MKRNRTKSTSSTRQLSIRQSTSRCYIPNTSFTRICGMSMILSRSGITSRSGRDSVGGSRQVKMWKRSFTRRPSKNLKRIRNSLIHTGSETDSSENANSLVQFWKMHDAPEMVDYLIFAKQCEPYVSGYEDWSDNERTQRLERTKRNMDTLLVEGRKRYRESKSEHP